MKRILAFLTLVLACAAAAMPGLNAADKGAPKIKHVGVEEFDKLRQNPTNVVLDVRTKKEHGDAHLPGAVLIDIIEDNFEEELRKLDKSKTYLVHCAVGGRSSRACKKMEQLGFTNLYNLKGGLAAWQKAGKPVAAGKK
jgi:rhodanese-related sulfurtransferase